MRSEDQIQLPAVSEPRAPSEMIFTRCAVSNGPHVCFGLGDEDNSSS